MGVLVENTSTLGRRLTVSVPSQLVSEKIKNKMVKLAKEAHLKGFRKGKVPETVLQQKFGESIRMEVINDLIRESLGQAIQERDLHPAGTPKIAEMKDEKDKNLEFVALFEEYPQIILKDLSDVEIIKKVVEITQDDITNMVKKLQDQFANWVSVDRAVQNDDKLTVDFKRKLLDENAKEEEQKNVQMIIGAQGVLPGLNEALIGKNKNDEVENEFEYPENWTDANVAGKRAMLWVKIHDIAQKHTLSQEELLKKFGLQEGTQEDLRMKVHERMKDELDKTLRDELKEDVLEKLLEKNPIEIPQALIDQEKEAIYRELSRNKHKMPKELINSPDVENAAIKRVELGLLLNEIIKHNNLKADNTLVRAEIEKIASKFSKPSEIIEAYYGSKELLYSVERLVLLEQAVDAILKSARINEIKATFDEVMNPTEGNV